MEKPEWRDYFKRKREIDVHDDASEAAEARMNRILGTYSNYPIEVKRTKRRIIRKTLHVEKTDRTFDYDPYDFEQPTKDATLPWIPRDLSGNFTLPYRPRPGPGQFHNVEARKPLVGDLKFPNVLDNRPEYVWRIEEKLQKERIPKPKKKKKAKKTKTTSRRQRENEADNVGEDPWSIQRPSPLFRHLPLEIRLQIYRELLFAQDNVLVHSNWTDTYKQSSRRKNTTKGPSRRCPKCRGGVCKLCTQSRFPDIMFTCRAVFEEAQGVLYGENVFHYRVRDALDAGAALVDIDHNAFAHDGTVDDMDISDDSGSDWEADHMFPGSRSRTSRATRLQSRRRAQRGPAKKGLINIERYARFFKDIVIEAEQNRYDEAVQQRMAMAIRVFDSHRAFLRDPNAENGRRTIRSLTIKITPTRLGRETYTFVDFFQKSSPVIAAIKDMDCQFLHVVMQCDQLSFQDEDILGSAPEAPETISIALHAKRIGWNIRYNKEDVFGDEDLGLACRSLRLKYAETAIDDLGAVVWSVCQYKDVTKENSAWWMKWYHELRARDINNLPLEQVCQEIEHIKTNRQAMHGE